MCTCTKFLDEGLCAPEISWQAIPNTQCQLKIIIDPQKKGWLERLFEEMEGRKVLKNMVGDKSLGLDGFTMAFFQPC